MESSSARPVVFKIFRMEEWAEFERIGEFRGSPDDARDGFIHLSTADQVEGTLAKHFASSEAVVLAEVATEGLPIRMEKSRNDELFPHLYGVLRLEDVVCHKTRTLP